jgi:4-hydroxy-tetrahydrodipicolinate synthase
LPLFRWDSNPRFVQAIKYAFELTGNPVGTTRPPRMPRDEADRQSEEKAYAHLYGSLAQK